MRTYRVAVVFNDGNIDAASYPSDADQSPQPGDEIDVLSIINGETLRVRVTSFDETRSVLLPEIRATEL